MAEEMLDPRRWDETSSYLSSDLYALLVDIQREILAVRQSYLAAQLIYARQCDAVRLENWQETVAAQDRAVALETRNEYNVVETTKSDLQQLLDEREMVRLLIEHKER